MMEEEEAKQMSQYQLQLKLDRMTQRAFGDRDKLQKAPKKPLSEVDIEVIKEYQKQFNEPIKVLQYDIDPETGEQVVRLLEDGTPDVLITKKYRTVPPPELETVEIMKLVPIPSDEELAIAQQNELLIRDAIRELEQEFKDMQAQRKKLIKDLDEQKPPFQDPPRFFQETYLGKPQPRRNPNYVKQLAQVQELRQDAVDSINEFEDMLEQIRNEIIELTDNYQEGVRELRMVGQNVQRNEAEIASVKKINYERVKNYQETLNLMNRGAFQQDQMPGETEEDYVRRLQANAEEAYTTEALADAELDIRRKFKEALKKIIRDDVKIEQVANSITDNEIKIKTEILKKLPLFRKKYIEVYGLNNPVVSKSDILTFIDGFIQSISGNNAVLSYLEKEPLTVEERIEERGNENKTQLQLAEQDRKKVYIVENPNNRKKVYFRLSQDFETDFLYLLYSFSGKRNTYNEFVPTDADLTPYDLANDRENSFKEIFKQTQMKPDFLKSQFNNKPYKSKSTAKSSGFNWIEWLGTQIETTTNYDRPFPSEIQPPYEYDERDYPETMGWGIKQEEIPEIVPFGKIKIALNKLFYKNILSARHNNLGRIAGFQNVKVSDELVLIIMKMIRGEKVIKQEIDALQKTEQMLYDRLLSLANLHKKAPNNKDSTIRALKERMDLIGGEIDAGNDNKVLVKELYNIVHALKNFGVITNKEATKYLSQF